MPTVNPRVNVTLSPSLFQVVGRLAKLQGGSRSQVLRELLQAAEPALQRVVTLMAAVEQAKGTLGPDFGASLLRAQDSIESQMSGFLSQIEDGPDLVSQAEVIRSRRATSRDAQRHGSGASEGATTPVAVNTGVRSGKPAHVKSAKGAS